MIKFEAFPKIPRLYKHGIVVTEKIDGTNGQILIVDVTGSPLDTVEEEGGILVKPDEANADLGVTDLALFVGSRNRTLTDKSDNFGFWHWVEANAQDLSALGVGRHYGEWWGRGIQRGYNKEARYFSLFNTGRWYDSTMANASTDGADAIPRVDGLAVVPVLYRGRWFGLASDPVADAMRRLEYSGSTLDVNSDAEGVVVFHEGANAYFKAPFKEEHKGAQ